MQTTFEEEIQRKASYVKESLVNSFNSKMKFKEFKGL